MKSRNYKKELKNIYDALAESIMEMTDAEVEEEVLYLGEDMKTTAQDTRNLVCDTIKKYKKHE